MKLSLPRAHVLVLLAGCAFLGACSETQLATYGVKEAIGTDTRGGVYKVGKPYQIQGVWYYPGEDYSYSETGVASWYGPDFHGKYTANGEIFDQNDVTAAHRTLPMPCFVRVTNLDNGRSLVVRINDRGPFAHGRVLDLSKRAAQLLGMEGTGTAKVKVEIMADESRELAMNMKAKQQLDEPPVEAVSPERLLRAVAQETGEEIPLRLTQRIMGLRTNQKIMLAIKGGKEERTLLIREANRLIQVNVIRNGRITQGEVAFIAQMRSINEEVLRIIASNRDWMKKYAIVKALVLNPKTPIALALNFFKRLVDMDLKLVMRDKGVAEILRREVKRYLALKTPS